MIARVLSALLALLVLAPILHAADTYTVDGAHTTIGFRVSHLVISKVQGRFNKFAGQITLSPQEPHALLAVTGSIQDPWGKTRIGLATKLTINRKDYGLTYNKVLETGGLAVGEQVEIDISAEAVKDAPPSP